MGIALKVTLASAIEKFSIQTEEDRIIIGRSSKCDFRIEKEDLSREHCMLQRQRGDFYITDLGSKNGVWIDGVRLSPNQRIRIKEKSEVILSNIYTLTIQEVAETLKEDTIVSHIAEEPIKTSQIQLESLLPQRRRPKKQVKTEVQSRPKKDFENLKILLGFLAILAFIIYQARGR